MTNLYLIYHISIKNLNSQSKTNQKTTTEKSSEEKITLFSLEYILLLHHIVHQLENSVAFQNKCNVNLINSI